MLGKRYKLYTDWKEEAEMDRIYEQMEYDGIRPSEAYAPDGAFLALNEQNVYVTHTSNSDFEVP